MPKILLTTEIHAPIDLCFDLARSIDLHTISTAHTHEKAIAGKTSGLIGLNETVTWEAIHFGVKQNLTTVITAYDRPHSFTDAQTKGIFTAMVHHHRFVQKENKVHMYDEFRYQSPLGILGQLADLLFLKNYMKRLLEKRKQTIKEFAESNRWKEVLHG